MKDDLIEKIRETRKEISGKFNHDPDKLIDHYIELQNQLNQDQENKNFSKKNAPIVINVKTSAV